MRWITTVVLVTLIANVAAATTAADRFRSSVESKVTPPSATIGSAGQFKALCVCNATGEVGVVESFNGTPTLGVTCTVPTFDADGTFVAADDCDDWTPVTK
jgi:hypothetical protein